jgi:cell division protein WhiA
MSFSSSVKEELVRIKAEDRCCQLAELSAIIRIGGTIKLMGKSRIGMEITTESASTARLIFSMFKKVLNTHVELLAKENNILKRGHLYVISLDDAKDVLQKLGIIDYEEGYMRIIDRVPTQIAKKECCKRSYLRGAFLGGGSLSDPEKGYHFEIVAHSDVFAVDICNLFEEFEIGARIVERKGSYVVYVKEGDQIVDILNIMGAHNALLSFENVRIIKSMRNSINRIVNCETANMNKTVNASVKQIMDIEYIQRKLGLDSLPDNLRDMANLRLENREASLKELGEVSNPPIGKSGVNHRLKRIEAIAEELRKAEKR